MRKKFRSSVSRLVLEWLDGYTRQQTILSVAGAVGALLAGIVVLVVTYYLLQGILYFLTVSFGMSLRTAAVAVPVLTWSLMALLFVAYAWADWDHLQKLEVESRGRVLTARIAAHGLGSPFLALAAGPRTAHAFVKVISTFTLAGPALLATSWRLMRCSLQWQRCDREAMTELIARSLKSGGKVNLAEVIDEHPQVDWERVLPDLSRVDGVVFLHGPPAAVTLTDGFRDRISEWRQRRRED